MIYVFQGISLQSGDMAMPSLHPESRICRVQWWLSYPVKTFFYLVFPGIGLPRIFEGLGQVDSFYNAAIKS